uniref:PX domain-containing protein n=1 Tax=Palpitomonas bilix TaxID=652834 RepID=A0A7S3DHJ1_9EUKA
MARSIRIPEAVSELVNGKHATFYRIEYEEDGVPDSLVSANKRYSELLEFNNVFKKNVKSQGFFEFPPKRLFRNNDPGFIERRRQDLEE